MTCGPDDRDLVVLLPESMRFSNGERRATIAEVRSHRLDQLRRAMNDPVNWVGLLSHFPYEQALSDYIAAYPHRLEDGMALHPDKKVRELVFSDRTRLDVLLLDRDGRPVVVECKQGQPSIPHLKQLRGYMKLLKREIGHDARGILVHGGAQKLRRDVANAASSPPRVEIVRYRLQVDFASSKLG
jgi:RecB family endonuclease NucS